MQGRADFLRGGFRIDGGDFGRGADGMLKIGTAARAAATVLTAMRRGGKSRPHDRSDHGTMAAQNFPCQPNP
jgi:hypothetical protein